MEELFGTDGVRGKANDKLTIDIAVALARASASTITRHSNKVIIGRDTRISGTMLEAALAAGFAACGMEVLLAGIVPTPAISFLIKDEHADFGAVVSASHNPPQDNGIKFFDHIGVKLTVDQEKDIQAAMARSANCSTGVGGISPLSSAAIRYGAFLTGAIEAEEIDLADKRIVVDCAHGATSVIAPQVLRHFNANIIELNTELDGTKINQQCGSTYLSMVRGAVKNNDADLGVAFDGDGDRAILVSRHGETINGDHMMGIAALYLKRLDQLKPSIVVSTVMSNMGLEQTLAKNGIRLLRTPVGDRNVTQMMLAHNAKVGGEPSGHVVLSDHTTTGDGILAIVKLLEIANETGKDLGKLAQEIALYPQQIRNIEVDNPKQAFRTPPVQEAIEAGEKALAGNGRMLVRPSGTQPLLRVMVEAEDNVLCEKTCNMVVDQIRNSLPLD